MIGYVIINVTLFLTNYILEVNFMKRILSLFAAFAVMLSLSACQPKDTVQDLELVDKVKTSETIESIVSSADTKQVSSETTAPDNSEETLFVTEFEITDWTMEELVDNIYLCGQKITLPSKVNELDADLKLSSYYDVLFDETVSTISYKNQDISLTYFNGDCINSSDRVITNIQYGLNQLIPEFNIMGITESSTPDEVKNILGEPNYIQDDGNSYRYIFSDKKQLMLSFNDDYTGIDFYYVIYEEK